MMQMTLHQKEKLFVEESGLQYEMSLQCNSRSAQSVTGDTNMSTPGNIHLPTEYSRMTGGTMRVVVKMSFSLYIIM
jgi:hypothetical protein